MAFTLNKVKDSVALVTEPLTVLGPNYAKMDPQTAINAFWAAKGIGFHHQCSEIMEQWNTAHAGKFQLKCYIDKNGNENTYVEDLKTGHKYHYKPVMGPKPSGYGEKQWAVEMSQKNPGKGFKAGDVWYIDGKPVPAHEVPPGGVAYSNVFADVETVQDFAIKLASEKKTDSPAPVQLAAKVKQPPPDWGKQVKEAGESIGSTTKFHGFPSLGPVGGEKPEEKFPATLKVEKNHQMMEWDLKINTYYQKGGMVAQTYVSALSYEVADKLLNVTGNAVPLSVLLATLFKAIVKQYPGLDSSDYMNHLTNIIMQTAKE